MKIVIVGGGKIGSTLAECLTKEGNDVTLIDNNPQTVENIVNTSDLLGIVGNGVNFSVQRDAGVVHADVMIATTYSDEINMLCCLIAKKLGVRHTVARIRDPEYSKQFIYMLDEMGLNLAVNPEYEAACEIFRLIRFPSAIGIDTFAKGYVDLAEMKIGTGSVLDGIRVTDIQKNLNVRLLVCAVQHGENVYIPNGNSILYAGDKIHFTASRSQIADFFRKTGAAKQKLRNIFIIGGGHISYYLARQLLDSGMAVKIIELDEKRCAELSELLPKAQIICGDGTDQVLLREENFDKADACVAATGIDEENIITSLYAKSIGINKIITKISKASLTDMLESVGLDSIVSPKQITSNLILSYVRAINNATGSNVRTLYKLVGDRAEALEFYVTENSKVIQTPLKDLKRKLKNNLLIACIIRSNTVLIPGGNDVILPGDSVIVTAADSQFTDIDDILR